MRGTLWAVLSCMYACLYILEIWNVKLYDYPELILIFYRLVTFKNLLNTLSSQYAAHNSLDRVCSFWKLISDAQITSTSSSRQRREFYTPCQFDMPVGKRVNFDESFRDAPQFDVRSLARSRTLLILDDLTGRSRRSHRFMKISPLSLHAVQEFTRRRAVCHIAHADTIDKWHVISHCSSWLTRSVSRSVAISRSIQADASMFALPCC